jgi:hypothetical protein
MSTEQLAVIESREKSVPARLKGSEDRFAEATRIVFWNTGGSLAVGGEKEHFVWE